MDNKEVNKTKKKRTLLQRVVNIFLYIGLGILILLILAFGFSQTSTFRNYLKDFVVDKADSALNGNLHIDKIEGTILTSLILKNVVINMGKDTLLKAGAISVKTSPLELLFKKIYVRDFEIRNAIISLKKDKSGELNISKLFPPSSQKDTSKSTFPFDIQVAKLLLNNVNFAVQNYNKTGSKEIYDSLNVNDLRVDKVNLELNAFADINKNDFQVEIEKFNASTNISHFFLDNLEGKFHINEKGMEVNNLSIVTGRSKFTISSNIVKFSPFDSTTSFSDADINLNLNADSLNFADLSAFVPSTKILKGKVNAKVKTSGSLDKMNINLLEVLYDSTQLKAKGSIKNLANADKMYITTSFYNSYVNQSDINKLLPSLQIPVYPQLGLLKFDTLLYYGNPLNFNTNVFLNTKKGDLSVKGNLNLLNPLFQYNISFRTINFDISPFAGINTNLTSRGRIKGAGTSPQNLDANIYYRADGSIIKGNKLDTLRLRVSAKSKNIKYRLVASSDTMNTSLTGNFDFTNNVPSYKLKGDIKNFNIAKLLSDSSLNTGLNFSINAEGENFQLDKINLYLSMKLYNSVINKIHIDSTRAIVDLRSNDNGQRIIDIISDLADISLSGNFSMDQAINLASAEADLISRSLENKLNELFPDSGTVNQNSNISESRNKFADVDSSISVKYLIDLKNFELISLFLGKNHLEVDGDISGEIKNDRDSIQISLDSRLNYVKYWGSEGVYFLSNSNLDFNLKNSFNSNSLKDIYAGLHIKTDRIFAGSDIKNINLNLNLANNNADFDLAANMESTTSKLAGSFDLNKKSINLSLDTLYLKYNQFILLNSQRINLAYSSDSIKIENFVMERVKGLGKIEINGNLLQNGNQDLKISLKDFRGKDLSKNLLELKAGNTLLGSINLNSDITGDFSNPVMNLKFDIDSTMFKGKNLGALIGNLNYKDKNLDVDLRFVDSINNYKNPELLISGNIPVDLGLKGVTQRLPDNQPINLKLQADNFNLAAFDNIVPELRELKGYLDANLSLSGNFNNLEPNGTLTIKNADFISSFNNLEYYAGVKINISPGSLSLDSLVIENSKGTLDGGKMTGSGKAEMENLDITSSQFVINGNLKVLSEASKDVSPTVYGNLVISTNGNVEFTMDKSGISLTAPVNVTNAELTFSPTQGGYQNNLQNFIYKYSVDTIKHEEKNIDFESLVKLSQQKNNSKAAISANGFTFDYNIDVNVEKEAKIIFILSKELNQKLTAVLNGDFQYKKIGGVPNAQGELKLLEGSNLQFFKTLTAEGSIKFESELSNPYLDIVATYTGYYTPAAAAGDSTASSQEEKVAVKIKIQGPLNELNKNFMQEKNNIAVYVGQSAIDNDEPASDLDASDAIAFIVAGQFLNPEYSGSKTASGSAFVSTSTSLAGSILGGFLSSYLGDYVRSVQLRKVGNQTRVSLAGNVKDFRYTIGGSQLDLSQANVMIEYPILKSLLARLERKEAIGETAVTTEMMYELGLKYKFEF